MANRFWVGGTAAWDGTAGTKWALTSGGAGGQAVPTTADDVFFDATSGAGTVTVATGNTGCHSLDFNGYTGTMASSANLSCTGSLRYSAVMSWTGFVNSITMDATTLGNTITSNGTVPTNSPSLQLAGVGGEWILQDDLIYTSGGVFHTAGTFDLNNKNANILVYSDSASATVRTLKMGTSTMTLTTSGAGNGVSGFSVTGTTNLTITGSGFTIAYNQNGTGRTEIRPGGYTWNGSLTIGGTGTGITRITASGTFGAVSDTRAAQRILEITAATTLTCTSFTMTPGMTLRSSSAGTQYTLSIASGRVVLRACFVNDCIGTGGATFWSFQTQPGAINNTGWAVSSGGFAIGGVGA